MNLNDLRKEYSLRSLDEREVDRDPMRQFDAWMAEAIQAQVPEPTAMHLSTVDGEGQPSGRIVLLKETDATGFVFFTNYASRKGRELAANDAGALTFMWKELERQVRIEGAITKVEAAVSDAYYSSRPLGARIGAWASPQSEPIESRAWLEQRLQELAREHGENPPRPPHWGGYRLVASHFEFWQGRQSRLHDRIIYDREGPEWRIRRLAP
ncbi:pyridoxamine 5'-phosphate oxidase [Usitatibacter palustris]|uniref:Pyridoxine/pyridoxamine 5'-phosphate oxidase n=1 Tax=Usitatibacter palustris TaxID=2732487 RepID=A0A6M4H7Z6_9PROT|nr:pyridoxamine 5'-phosphate oxidase [Usitatibacter palustris]QJR14117.1 Pyridoxine/pyridoxamine 5'-phosphate oxidase [Usitatibacter palustris]